MEEKYDFIPRWMKCSMIFLNILYWCLGACSGIFGYYLHVYQMRPIQEFISVQFSPAYMLVVTGMVLFITAVFGYIGAERENISFLHWVLIILHVLLMVHIAIGVVAFVVLLSPPTVPIHAEIKLKNAVITYQDDEKSANYINRIQTSVQCCGIGQQGYKDWMLNTYFACTEDNYNAEKCSVPPTCCRLDWHMERFDSTCGYGITNEEISQSEASSIINIEGCIPKIEETVLNTAALICFDSFAIAITLIVGIVLTSRTKNILEKKVSEYWKSYSFDNNMMNYVPNAGIYAIPDRLYAQKNIYKPQ